MSNRTYDIIKAIGLIAVPVLAFIASLCTIWNFPHCAEITATLTAIDSLIGALVMVAKRIYEKDLKNE